jgi:hypothetical protein
MDRRRSIVVRWTRGRGITPGGIVVDLPNIRPPHRVEWAGRHFIGNAQASRRIIGAAGGCRSVKGMLENKRYRTACTALAFSAALGLAMPSRGGNLSDAMDKAFDAFCGMNLRYIEAMFMQREPRVVSPATVRA